MFSYCWIVPTPAVASLGVFLAFLLYQKLQYSNLYILSLLSIQVGAHYFEEGNVQLDAQHECKDTTLIQVSDYCLSMNFSFLYCRQYLFTGHNS